MGSNSQKFVLIFFIIHILRIVDEKHLCYFLYGRKRLGGKNEKVQFNIKHYLYYTSETEFE